MKTIDTPFQIQLWALAGPFTALLTLFMLLAAAPENRLLLALALTSGVLICWKWQLKALSFSSTMLVALLAYQFFSLSWSAWFWQAGMAFSLFLVYAITALSFAESSDLLKALLAESEKPAAALQEAEAKHSELCSQMERMQQEAHSGKAHAESLQKLIELAREDLTNSCKAQEELNQSLLEKKQEIAKLQDRLSQFQALSAQYDKLVHLHNDQNEALLKKEKEVKELSLRLERSERELASTKSHIDRYAEETRGEMNRHLEEKALKDEKISLLEKELSQALILQEDKSRPYRILEGKFLQLTTQFAEKSYELDKARAELFMTQEKLSKLEHEMKESTFFAKNETEEKLIQHLLEQDKEIDSLQREVKALEELFSS